MDQELLQYQASWVSTTESVPTKNSTLCSLKALQTGSKYINKFGLDCALNKTFLYRCTWSLSRLFICDPSPRKLLSWYQSIGHLRSIARYRFDPILSELTYCQLWADHVCYGKLEALISILSACKCASLNLHCAKLLLLSIYLHDVYSVYTLRCSNKVLGFVPA